MRRWPVGLVLWLLVLTGAEIVLLVGVWQFFVAGRHGQLLDTVALDGNTVGQARIERLVRTILNTISLLSLAIATGAVAFIAVIRRRVALAFGITILVVGANLTAQALKHFLHRPELGVDLQRASAGNSLPSGHTTIAASVAVALILVLPGRVRAAGALAGAVLTTAAGVATLSAGWHRPSDAIAALLVVGGWACVASLFIVVAQRRHGGVDYGRSHPVMSALLAIVGLALLAGAGVAAAVADRGLDAAAPEDLGRNTLLAGYGGGALGIAAAVCLVFAGVLATVHRVAPEVVPEPVSERPPNRPLVSQAR